MSGTQSTGALTASATYTLNCTGGGGSATQSATVSVTAPTPTVTFTASPSTVASGSSSTLTWAVHQCHVLHRLRRLVGCQGRERLAVHRRPHGQCHLWAHLHRRRRQRHAIGHGFGTQTPPAVTLTASPSTVASGARSTLSWSSTNATSCTASGGMERT